MHTVVAFWGILKSISRVAEPEPAPTGMVYTYCTTWRETDRDQRLIARNGQAARDGLHIPGGRQTWTSEISLKRLIARDGQAARDGLHIPGGRQTGTSEISLKFINLSSSSRAMSRPKH